MSWALVRIDDRLIHGQVVVAWGSRMQPRRIWVADDAAAADAWERELLAGTAPGVEVRVVSIAEVAAAWETEAAAPEPAFLLVRDLAAALALVRAGAPVRTMNIGGLHYAPGKTKVHESVYLDEHDRLQARALLGAGIRLDVQDVPAARPESLVHLDPSLGGATPP
ncbi:MAG: PTS transporter subunit IIB [Candidatus Eisenbacteria bacterium]|uniref:PTS transporter subunit IIB n=1 Tax=Eiseniibacteriota bacterium TaxID=2212470 RepID=A0A849SJ63_UNCEI|nr:PTS transporter subunit IIB [Candidatus Eisenbacteria bacterium]